MALFLNIMGLVIFFEIIFVLFSFWTLFIFAFTKVPFARTPKKNLKIALDELNLKPGSKIYDLGCGDGNTLFLAEEMGLEPVGFELSPYPYLKAVIRKILAKSRIKIRRENFFKADLSPAEAVFVFLIPGVMAKVGEKLKNNLNPGTPVVSYGFQFPGWTAEKILNTQPSKTYFYRV